MYGAILVILPALTFLLDSLETGLSSTAQFRPLPVYIPDPKTDPKTTVHSSLWFEECYILTYAQKIIGVNAFIIPEELPTLLSVIYSNIPPIKLGFDTRFGFGFRIGPHADFQTIVELGPQENTQPIGTENETVAKRHSRTRGTLEEFGESNKIADENIRNDSREDTVIQPNLADIILGRKRKKQAKQYFDEIDFKKVSGIDDVKKNPKTSRSAKVKGEKSANRILVSR